LFFEVAIFRQYVPTCCQNTIRILNFSTFLLYISCNQIWLSPLVDDHQPTRHLPHQFENKTLPTGYLVHGSRSIPECQKQEFRGCEA
jgi:hypothetical protein